MISAVIGRMSNANNDNRPATSTFCRISLILGMGIASR